MQLDEETAEEENADFDPEEELRDYNKVARDLPVYCVSSRAYQKLSGRLVKDNAVRGFTDIEQIEVRSFSLQRIRRAERSRFPPSRCTARNSQRMSDPSNAVGFLPC